MNVSVIGPVFAPIPVLYSSLMDLNGTLVDQQWVVERNGTFNFSFALPLELPSGDYLLNITAFYATPNATLVAQIAVQVIYDEVNYLAKRVALLEIENRKQAHDLETQRLEMRDFRAKVAWYWLVPITVLVLFILLGWWWTQYEAPVALMVHEWRHPKADRLNKAIRLADSFHGRYAPEDQRSAYTFLRVRRLPIELDPVHRAQRRALNLPQESIPQRVDVPEPPPRPRVKKVLRQRRGSS